MHQNDIAVFAHDLGVERIAAGDAHLVLGRNIYADDALQPLLGNLLDAAAREVFAQKHAEVERLIRVGLLLGRQVQARVAARGGKQQPLFAFPGMKQQNGFVFLRHIYLFDLRACQRSRKLADQGAEGESV